MTVMEWWRDARYVIHMYGVKVWWCRLRGHGLLTRKFGRNVICSRCRILVIDHGVETGL